MANMNMFDRPEFSVYQLTEAINIEPNQYGRIGELGLFSPKPVTTTGVFIERKHGILNVLPQTQRGGPAVVNKTGKRDQIPFIIPNFTLEDAVYADEIQNVRAFGSQSELAQLQTIILDKLDSMRAKHEITLEYMRAGALRGIILDDEGNELLNLYDAFGQTPVQIDFALGTAGTDVPAKIRQVKRAIKKNLQGEIMTSVYCLCSPSFFDKLIAHPSVKEAFNAYQASSPYRDDKSRDFYFQGVVFEEYEGSAFNSAGTELPFIPEGDARFFPLGTRQSFLNWFAPADFMETVNTPGLPFYAKQAPDPDGWDRKRLLLTQSNPLPICARPNILVRGYSSN